MKKLLADLQAKVPPDVKLVLALFVLTRVALTLCGIVARITLAPLQRPDKWFYIFQYHKKLWLDIWSVYDSAWYLHIAEHWYDLSAEPTLPRMVEQGQSAIAFFPLYPGLMKGIGAVIGSPYVAGVLISNVALIASGIFLYRLVKLRYGDETGAATSVKFLFLFPTAFILSGIFTESLFLALLLGCLYYGQRKKWLLAGVLAFFLSSTRSVGVLVVLPLGWEYLRGIQFKLRDARAEILWLLLAPAALGLVMLYNWHLTGDPLAFVHVQKYWGRESVNPFGVLWHYLTNPTLFTVFATALVLLAFLALCVFIRQIGVAYWFFGMCMLLIPLANTGDYLDKARILTMMPSMARFALAVFPLYILLGKLGRYERIDTAVTVLFGLIQGALMAFWVNGLPFVV